MTCWFVSRHPGAIAWAKSRNLAVDRWVEHLDVAEVGPDDTVIGTLPVHLGAEVCARGARFVYLTFSLPAHLRGQELSEADLSVLDAHLAEFHVRVCGEK